MWFDEFCHLRITVSLPATAESECAAAPVLIHEQVVAFAVEWNTLSCYSEAGVTARLRLLYVIFMDLTSR